MDAFVSSMPMFLRAPLLLPSWQDGCYLNSDFLVTCNRSSGEPILFLGESETNLVITNISTSESEMEIMMFVARDCYNSSGPVQRTSSFLRSGDFWISTKNRFIAVGCDTNAYISGRRRNESGIGTGCISRCSSNIGITNGSCSGVGCCQVEIPQGMRSFDIRLRSYDNHTNILDFNPCSYAFVVEQEKYNFSTNHLLDFVSDQGSKMPMLLDWAIGNQTCQIASKEPDTFLCKGKGQYCVDAYGHPGYRCRCKDGYEGNPYIEDGCKNINECERKDPRLCQHECIDLDGDYECRCPKGYSGGDKKDGTGCTADESLVIKIVAGTLGAAIFLLVFIAWLYLGLKKRKLLMLKEKFFRQNGGIMLQQRISGEGNSHHDQAKVFTIEELKRATNNYDETRIIGKGGFGTVYKGVLSDKRTVAIKKSKLVDQTQSQIEQFINEVVILSQINHRNVVKLIGCCLETEVPLLVYEFISNGTLSDHVHNESRSLALTWDIRLRIATETAGALSYLHSAASVPII
ncbi:Concanavalin A-like lectin/glucanase, subgroup, partial [Cynara cardunculus var. scolymus]